MKKIKNILLNTINNGLIIYKKCNNILIKIIKNQVNMIKIKKLNNWVNGYKINKQITKIKNKFWKKNKFIKNGNNLLKKIKNILLNTINNGLIIYKKCNNILMKIIRDQKNMIKIKKSDN